MPTLSCPAACNGSLLPNTLDINTFVAVDKDLHIGLTLFFFFLEHCSFFHINTSYWFQQIPCTHDMNTHPSILFHPPLSSSENLLFLHQPTKVLPQSVLYSRGGQTFSIKSQAVNILAFAVHEVSAAASPHLCCSVGAATQ